MRTPLTSKRSRPRRRLAWRGVFFVLAFVAVGTMTSSSGVGEFRLQDSFDSQIAQVQAQVGQLQSQLAGVQGQQAAASAAVAATEQQLAITEAQLSAAQMAVDELNSQLAQTSSKLVATRERLAKDRATLAQMAVNTYEQQASDFQLHAVINSSSLSDALNNVAGLQHVSSSMAKLANTVQADEDQLNALLVQQTKEEAAAAIEVAQITALKNQEAAQQAQEQAQLNALTGQSSSIAGQISGLNKQINGIRQAQAAAAAAAAAAASHGTGGGIVRGGAIPPFGFGARSDAFPWGQCTWYVASLRDVPWSGDAWAWAGNARAYGYAESSTPRVGSIVVWGAGNGYSGYGHVAYVVSVQSSTSFVVDEANYLGLGVVDQRQVLSLHDVKAFIL